MFIVYWLVSFFILWVLFVNVMWIIDNRDRLPTWSVKPLTAFAFVAVLYDVLFNITFGTIMFLQKPDFAGAHFKWKGIGFPTLTERMRDALRYGRGHNIIRRIQFYQARFYCRYLVEPWDEGHCGLKKFGVDE